MIGSGHRSPLHRIRIYWNFWYDVFSDGGMDDKKATQGENDQFYHYGEFIDFCYLLYKGRYILRSTFLLYRLILFEEKIVTNSIRNLSLLKKSVEEKICKTN